ncbi:hypothetical protein GCM10022221_75870 [Actinocorallia aurea]
MRRFGRAADTSFPTSRDVRAIVERGLASGWTPISHGPPFFLSEHDAPPWNLPGFLLTDRLRDPDAPDPTPRVTAAHPRRALTPAHP